MTSVTFLICINELILILLKVCNILYYTISVICYYYCLGATVNHIVSLGFIKVFLFWWSTLTFASGAQRRTKELLVSLYVSITPEWPRTLQRYIPVFFLWNFILWFFCCFKRYRLNVFSLCITVYHSVPEKNTEPQTALNTRTTR